MKTVTEEINELVDLLPYCKPHVSSLENDLEGQPYAKKLILYLLKEFIIKNEPCASEIVRSVALLKKEDDPVPAIKKTARAIYKGKINIFFSYKLKNESAASKVVKALRSASANQFNIVYAEEFNKGDTYKDKIRRATRNANWFILLLPERSDDWDWCLYESGLFNATKLSSDRLICIHHENTKIPKQINDFNAVAATPGDVNKFLKQIYCTANPLPGMEAINPDAPIESIGEDIIRAVSPPSKITTNPVVDYVLLEANNPEREGDEARILDFSHSSLDIFGKVGTIKTWGDLAHTILKKYDDKRWHTQIRDAIQLSSEGDKPRPVWAAFLGRNGKMYRPSVHAINTNSSGNVCSIQITFSEDIASIDTRHMPKKISVLSTALKLGFRFRWEVLENKEFLNPQMTTLEIQKLSNILDRMTDDAKSTGMMDPGVLVGLFEEPERKEVITRMFADWALMRNDEKTGELDLAMKNKNGQKIKEILRKLSPMNKKFLSLASERFAELSK